MSSIEIFTWLSVAMGFPIAAAIGYFGYQLKGVFWGFAFAIGAFILCVLLVTGANAANNFCISISSICYRTSDTTVWYMLIPLLFFPVFWVVMLVAGSWNKTEPRPKRV